MAGSELARRIDTVRRFNRFYTRRIGVLRDGLLGSPYSLAEARAALRARRSATGPPPRNWGASSTSMPGYLSRLLRGLERGGLVARTRSAVDGRRNHLALTGERTPRVRNAERPVERGSRRHARRHFRIRRSAVSSPRSRPSRRSLGARPAPSAPYLLRTHQPGDMGWVIGRHGALYAAGIRLGRDLRGVRRRDRRAVRPQLRPEARALLDRGARRPQRRRGLSRPQVRDGRAAAPADRRARGARPRHRQAAGDRVRALRAPRRLPEDRALDQRHPGRRATPLRGSRLSARESGAASQLRQGPRRPVLGARALARTTRPSRTSRGRHVKVEAARRLRVHPASRVAAPTTFRSTPIRSSSHSIVSPGLR